ncbi:MAG: TIGR00341 family protein [Bacteroidales bacterium]|nr:TIGR00341 family protein [Bacteroides sp.]MCM1197327.1 TIGR00341 family protein [Clostridium sp.]MCM1501851.1 TIGR00341 family protein [Bacteroidales bacterium]
MSVLNRFREQVKEIANLSEHVDTQAAQKAIRGNIYFKGPNVWILVFSIVIASVGLNVNSIPVIIGAMLISPLMGPIFGIGLGLGTNDLDLIKESLKNLLVMVLISLLASFIYFLITPLSLSNPTELLARTNPTIYDVLIALFGGLAGIFELCRKEKGTVFSGVAIATALMPPLCTAGFGLASGKLLYFIGALYLFFINCIFITLATYAMVKYMGFSTMEFESTKRKKHVKTIISIVVLVVIIPSIWSAITMIKENNFSKNVSEFISGNKVMNKAYIYDYKVSHHKGSKVELFISGETLTSIDKSNLMEAASRYGIESSQILINETASADALSESEIVKGIYERTDNEIGMRDAEIKRLENVIQEMQRNDIPYIQITKEITSQYPSIKEVFISKGAQVKADDLSRTDTVFVVIRSTSELSGQEKARLTNWIRIRLDFDNVVVYEETV